MIKHVRPYFQFFFPVQGTKTPSNKNVALARIAEFTTVFFLNFNCVANGNVIFFKLSKVALAFFVYN